MITHPCNLDKHLVFTEPNEYYSASYKCYFGVGYINYYPGEAYIAYGCLKTEGRFQTLDEVKKAIEDAFLTELFKQLAKLRELINIYEDLYNE